jgi:hypothetical protein
MNQGGLEMDEAPAGDALANLMENINTGNRTALLIQQENARLNQAREQFNIEKDEQKKINLGVRINQLQENIRQLEDQQEHERLRAVEQERLRAAAVERIRQTSIIQNLLYDNNLPSVDPKKLYLRFKGDMDAIKNHISVLVRRERIHENYSRPSSKLSGITKFDSKPSSNLSGITENIENIGNGGSRSRKTVHKKRKSYRKSKSKRVRQTRRKQSRRHHHSRRRHHR